MKAFWGKRIFSRVPKRVVSRLGKLAIVALVLISLVVRGPMAHADTAMLYSPLCLGTWRSVSNAEGVPNVTNPSTTTFSELNSAFIHNATGELFCGKFQADTEIGSHINAVRVRLSAGLQDDLPSIPTLEPSQQQQVDQAVQAGSVFVAPSPEPENTATPEVLLETSTPEPSVPDFQVVPVQETPTPEVPSALLRWLIPTAHASDDFLSGSLDDVLAIQWSVDGDAWNDAGVITRDALNSTISLELPQQAWNDLAALQIRIAVLQGLGQGTVYVDSVWLEADYDAPVIAWVEDAVNVVADALTPNKPIAEATPVPTPKEKRVVWNFDLVGQRLRADEELVWSDDDSAVSAQARGTLTASAGQIQVQGTCTETYFVVLLFRNEDDYAKNPASALYNAAYPCDGGSFEHTLTSLPGNVSDGTYWMLIAQQGSGSWRPISDLWSVHVSSQITEE